jgi:two-component system, cell cycle sensor histidine kinase and response regulator CckA
MILRRQWMKSAGSPLRWSLMLLAILAAGACLAGWLTAVAERDMRSDLLRQARLLAESINLEQVEALNGSEADLERAEYLQLKEQFSAVRSTYEHCRFIYLLGRRPDGDIFIFLDSEPSDSVDFSPPGQPFAEVSEGDRKVFDSKAPAVVGPVADRWGNWFSALVPLMKPRSDELTAVLGMDIDVRDWKQQIIDQAILPAVLFTLALISIAVFGLLPHAGCSRPAGVPYRLRDYRTPVLVLCVGLTLSLFASWFAHQKESRNRTLSFRNLAESRTTGLAHLFRDLRNEGLEGIARFFEGSDHVTAHEFQHYAEYLVKNPSVQAWGWMQPVPAEEKERFEKAARIDGLDNFEIWERDTSGRRVPASGRDIYYPIYYIAPLSAMDDNHGFDLGSEPVYRRAIEEVLDNSLTAASDPVAARDTSESSKIMQIYRPVREEAGSERLRGMVIAFLRLTDLLTAFTADSLLSAELWLLHPDVAPESVARSWEKKQTPARGPSSGRPIMTFGNVFWVSTHAGPDFLRLHPKRAGVLTVAFGMLLTVLIAVLVSLVQRRRQALEKLVHERTMALGESEERYRVLFDQAIDAMFILEPPLWRFTSCNPAAQKLFGVENPDDFRAIAPWKISPEKQPDGRLSEEKAREMIAESLRDGSCFHEWLHQSRDGKLIPCLVLLNRITMRDRVFLLATVRDITGIKREEEIKEKLQAQLVHAQKMESIGRLAGGIAHDFNNMLNVILGHTEIALEQIEASNPLYAELDEVRRTVGRSANLVRQLLGFARRQVIAPELLDLNRTVDGMLTMLRTLIGEDIYLVWRPAADLFAVKMDPGQIEQLLANLCINARDAIENIGAITIEMKNVVMNEDESLRRQGMAAGEYVMLRVADNGCGMNEETLQHLFEPFFSTKAVDKGTGLGLAMVYGIVQQNNGFIEVDSTPGKGTAFTVYMPGYRAKETVAPQSLSPSSVPPPRGCETILLVEDEPAIMRMAQRMLEKAGYTVLTANRPGEALQLAETCPGAIDLLITDVIMPGMNGRDLAVKLSGLIPGLACLYMSGYTADVIATQGILDPAVSFIQKPFSHKDLYEKVRETLNRKQSGPVAAATSFYPPKASGTPNSDSKTLPH